MGKLSYNGSMPPSGSSRLEFFGTFGPKGIPPFHTLKPALVSDHRFRESSSGVVAGGWLSKSVCQTQHKFICPLFSAQSNLRPPAENLEYFSTRFIFSIFAVLSPVTINITEDHPNKHANYCPPVVLGDPLGVGRWGWGGVRGRYRDTPV